MKIKEVFERKIDRDIPAVVKAEERDKERVWQELDEFVITSELRSHLDQLTQALTPVLQGEDRSGDNGIWITGFFGSGKSHLLKILAYLLENETHEKNGQRKEAIEFFETKLRSEAMLLGDLKITADGEHSAILFNIDNRAETNIDNPEEMMLKVFFSVLNEKQGYCARHLNVARVERHLSDKGLLDNFVEALHAKDIDWRDHDIKDEYDFYRDDIEEALANVLELSAKNAKSLLDEQPPVSVEELCKWVKAYLKKMGPRHHVNFLIDEVGQFIGKSPQRMLNLQTITEELGSQCKGRARIVVTAQEDLDSILGELSTSDELSKIQGRFHTKLSMSSSNVDEVVQQRVLKKSAAGSSALQQHLSGKEDILDSQLTFTDCKYSFPRSSDLDEHIQVYPIPAYQFLLIQKVFESIRKAGFAGKHLSQGERTVIGSCHEAVNQIRDENIGQLVPFYRHYQTVKEGLDTHVKATIQRAEENPTLQPEDISVLKLLFLIRYVDEMPGNVDNLVTLSIDQIDADKLAMRRSIEASLGRLERQSLIDVNAGRYHFLTNEEQDVNRSVKQERVGTEKLRRLIGELFYDELLSGETKVKGGGLPREFPFQRLVDAHPYGRQSGAEIEVYLAPPFGDEFDQFAKPGHEHHSASRTGCLFVCMQDNQDLIREMERYLQVEQYLRGSNKDELGESLNRILRDKHEENRDRRKRLLEDLKTEIQESRLLFDGRVLQEGGIGNPQDAVISGMRQVIQDSFQKISWISPPHGDPERELKSLLNNAEQGLTGLPDEFPHPRATDDLLDQIREHEQHQRPIKVAELLEKVSRKPFGWPEGDVLILLAHLYQANHIEFHHENHPLSGRELTSKLTSRKDRGDLALKPRTAASSETLRKAADLLYDLCGERPDESESPLAVEIHDWAKEKSADADTVFDQIHNNEYPGLETAREIRSLYADLATGSPESPSTFLQQFVEKDAALRDATEEFSDLQKFLSHQKTVWDQTKKLAEVANRNSQDLGSDEESQQAFLRIQEILGMPHPYAVIQELTPLQATVKAKLDRILNQARETALASIDRCETLVQEYLQGEATGHEATAEQIKNDFNQFREVAKGAEIKDRIDAQVRRAEDQVDSWLQKLSVPADQVQESAGGSKGSMTSAELPQPRLEFLSPADLADGSVIKDEDQMNQYLEQLREKISAILQRGGQVRIR